MNKILRQKIEQATGTIAMGFLDFNLGRVNSSDPNALPTNLANHILDFLTRLAYPLAFVGIVYSAYILLTSMGSPDGYTKAKKNVTFIATGIGLIIFAIAIFNVIARIFSNISHGS